MNTIYISYFILNFAKKKIKYAYQIRILNTLVATRLNLHIIYASASAANFKIKSAAYICICFPLLTSH